MHKLCPERRILPSTPHVYPVPSFFWWHFNRVADVFVSPSSESATAFVPFNTMCDVSARPLGRMRNACNVLLFSFPFSNVFVFPTISSSWRKFALAQNFGVKWAAQECTGTNGLWFWFTSACLWNLHLNCHRTGYEQLFHYRRLKTAKQNYRPTELFK